MPNSTYDPVKAHEYYEKHKKLKGRKKGQSTKSLSKEQKQQFTEAKAYLSAQKSEANKKSKEQINQAKKKQQETLTKQAQAKIESLRKSIQHLTPEQKRKQAERISGVIDRIRETTAMKKQAVSERATAKSKKATETNQKAYDKAVENAYKQIKSKKK